MRKKPAPLKIKRSSSYHTKPTQKEFLDISKTDSKSDTRNSNFITLSPETYKKYFKSYIKNQKNSKNIKDYNQINNLYLKNRKDFEKYVTDEKNKNGLKLYGTKLFKNIPLKIFNYNYTQDSTILNKELENKKLTYIKPSKFSNEKNNIKLTPIPYKNNLLIHDEAEKQKISKAKRSAVSMRRLEYTHKIENKDIKNNKLLNSTNLCLLKGAVIIIEDCWIKYKNNYLNKLSNSSIYKSIQNMKSIKSTNTEIITISTNSIKVKSIKVLPKVNRTKKKTIPNLNCSCVVYSRKTNQGFSTIINTNQSKKYSINKKKPETIEKNIFKRKIIINNKIEKNDENVDEKTIERDNTIQVNKSELFGRTCNLNYIRNLRRKKNLLNNVGLALPNNNADKIKNKNTISAKIINKNIRMKSSIDGNNFKNKENFKIDIVSIIKKNLTNKKNQQTINNNNIKNKNSTNLYKKAKINKITNQNHKIKKNNKSIMEYVIDISDITQNTKPILNAKNKNKILTKNNKKQTQNDSCDIKTSEYVNSCNIGTFNSINNNNSNKINYDKKNFKPNYSNNNNENPEDFKNEKSKYIPLNRNQNKTKDLKNELSSKTSSTVILNDSEFGSFINNCNDNNIKNNENNINTNIICNGATNNNRVENGINKTNFELINIDSAKYNLPNNKNNIIIDNSVPKENYNINHNQRNYINMNNKNNIILLEKNSNSNHTINSNINSNINSSSDIKPLEQDSSVEIKNIIKKTISSINDSQITNNIQSPISNEPEIVNKIKNIKTNTDTITKKKQKCPSFNKTNAEKLLVNSKLLKENPNSFSTVNRDSEKSYEIIYKNVNLISKKLEKKNTYTKVFKNKGDGDDVIINPDEVDFFNNSSDRISFNKSSLTKLQENQIKRKTSIKKYPFFEDFDNKYNNCKIKYIFYTNENKINNNSFAIQHNYYTYTAMSTGNIIKNKSKNNKINKNNPKNRKVIWSGELREGNITRRKVPNRSEEKNMKNVTKLTNKNVDNNINNNKTKFNNLPKKDLSLSQSIDIKKRFFFDRKISDGAPKNLVDSYNLLKGIRKNNSAIFINNGSNTKSKGEYVREFEDKFKE